MQWNQNTMNNSSASEKPKPFTLSQKIHAQQPVSEPIKPKIVPRLQLNKPFKFTKPAFLNSSPISRRMSLEDLKTP